MSAKTAGDINAAGGLQFDLTRQEQPLTLLENGQPVRYVLMEMDGDGSARYQEASLSGLELELDERGRPKQDKIPFAKLASNARRNEPLRISLCLFRVSERDGHEQRDPVPEALIKTWPARVVAGLTAALDRWEKSDPKEPAPGTLPGSAPPTS